MTNDRPLVHVRTPTYRRPDALRRCLESLQAQSWADWVCDVYDDDPDASASAVVEQLGDPRITYNQNRPQRFASLNIDRCFTRENPRDADFFCVAEDDNFLLPRFMEDNIRLSCEHGVEIVFRNQLIEWKSGTEQANIDGRGVLERKFVEGLYQPDLFRLAMIASIGVSNGGLFWSRHAVSDFEIGVPCSATLQEYMRTFIMSEPIYVALDPQAVWAFNGEGTTRDLGFRTNKISELRLKKSVGRLQRKAWSMAPKADRARFLSHEAFTFPVKKRARGLVKSHIRLNVGRALSVRQIARLAMRGGLIRLFGRVEPALNQFIRTRVG